MNDTNDDLKRRTFLGILAAAGLSGIAPSAPAAAAPATGYAAPDAPTYTYVPGSPIPPAPSGDLSVDAIPETPNILIVMVDQLRVPLWLSSSQMSALQTLCPNIYGTSGIYSKSVSFYQYCNAATACTPSRSTILTGLYSAQTAQFRTMFQQPTGIALDSNYPTFAWGLQTVNSDYADNCWWIGKWHLSYSTADGTASPLSHFGFNTQTIPGPTIPSPNGFENEGSEGGVYTCHTQTPDLHGKEFASDAQIYADFATWFGANATSEPWCTVVSFINPHDLSDYPSMLTPPACPTNPADYPMAPYFSAPPSIPTADKIYSAVPSPWNSENPSDVMDPTSPDAVKPALQWDQYKSTGSVSDYLGLLNYYYYLISFVDAQIGNVLTLLATKPLVAAKTVVIFTSDHGEYGGSHGLHSKAGAIYDEAMRIPLCVMIPGMTSAVTRYQLCSAVDFFGLICDLGTGGGGAWRTHYPNLSNRESIYNFLLSGSVAESHRLLSDGTPYILHTTDEDFANFTDPGATFQSEQPAGTTAQNHVTAIRTKTVFPSTPFTGAKFGVYTHWANCTLAPDSSTPALEFYDYGNTLYNRAEKLNNDPTESSNSDPSSLALRNQLKTALGDYGVNVGLIQTEINKALTGNGVNGTSLAATLATAQENYLNDENGSTCPT